MYFLVAGMLPVGTALVKTGAAELITAGLMKALGHSSGMIVLAGLVGLTILFTQVMNGAAVAAIMAPIGIQMAHSLGLDPRALAMGIALASSVAFLTPLGHPVNILVMGRAVTVSAINAKMGVLLTVIISIVILSVLPLFWRLV